MNGITSVRSLSVFAVVLAFFGVSSVPSAHAAIWGVKSQGPTSDRPAMLFSLDDNGENLTVVDTVKLNGHEIDVDALAMDCAGVLYGFQVADGTWSRLLTIDTATAEATVVGATCFGSDMRGATFTSDGRLFAIDAANNSLVPIDPSTGAAIQWAMPLTIDAQPHDTDRADLAQLMDGTVILAEGATSGSTFYELDVDSGELTLLHTDKTSAAENVPVDIAGIATSPNGDNPGMLFAYDIMWGEDIYQYDPANSWARTDGPLNIIPDFGAGRGDLAGPVVPEPATLSLLALGGAAMMWRRRGKNVA